MSQIDIRIETNRLRVEDLLARYAKTIGPDYDGYRNHVYRTISYAMHFLDYDSSARQAVETAMVYHDIALWTDKELAYLEPSEARAQSDNNKYGWGIEPALLRGIIHWHHKVLAYKGPHQRIIEACRKADWIDASRGWVRKGMSRANIVAVENTFPNCGFHQSLLRLAKDYSGSTMLGGIKVTRSIIKW